MCVDDVIPQTDSTDEQLILTSADGSAFAAYLARAQNPSGQKILMFPDINGLRTSAKELAHQLARSGADVLVIDYYGRTAGVEPREEIDRQKHTTLLDRANILADARAAVEYLQNGEIFALGFCLGAAMALYAGTAGLNLKGSIAFCPWIGAVGVSDELPEDFVAASQNPVLALFGADDHAVPVSQATAFEDHLTAAGIAHEIVVYPGQPHGFFELHHFGEPGHAEPAEDAWSRVVAFLRAADNPADPR